MTKVLSICFVLSAIILFTSCEKERAASEACIDTGTSQLKAGTDIYFMNCSKNYDYTKWIITDAANMPIYTEITDTLKHFKYTFAPGDYNVVLNIWQVDSVSFSTATKTFSITP